MLIASVQDETQYNIFQLDGAPKASTIYRFIKTTALHYKLLLDEDTKTYYPEQIAEIDESRTVFAGEGTDEQALEGLFAAEDKMKYFSMQQTRKGKKLKVSSNKIKKATKKEDFMPETINAVEALLKKLEIL